MTEIEIRPIEEIKERIDDLIGYIDMKKDGNPFKLILEGEFGGLCWALNLKPYEIKKNGGIK